MATARDAVAGLGRPAIPSDLAPALVARLAADRRRARLRALARPGRVALAVAGLSAMAASLLFALFLLHRSTHETGPDEPSPGTITPARPRSDPIPPIPHRRPSRTPIESPAAGPRRLAQAPKARDPPTDEARAARTGSGSPGCSNGRTSGWS